MKFKSKNLGWLAGRPVVILDSKTAEKYNLHVNDRISLVFKSKKIYAGIDLFSQVVKDDEIGLSKEIYDFLGNKKGEFIEVTNAEMISGAQIIKKKLLGKELDEREISVLVREITNNNLTETELAYFVSAEKIHGLSDREIYYLTNAMVNTGKQLDFKEKTPNLAS